MNARKWWVVLVKNQMTRIWSWDKLVPVTLMRFPHQQVLKYRTMEKDGYDAVVVWIHKKDANAANENKKADYDLVTEFRLSAPSNVLGDAGVILSSDIIKEGDLMHLTSTSKGKGYQGAMKRFHLKGWPKTHGSKFHRHVGSMGNRKPRRTMKWHPHAGHMWSETVSIKNIRVHDIVAIDGVNYVALHGSVPGALNSFVKVFFS